ncbi:hypothetical protein ETB97_007942 [Aspergillus alliaceus]|uniref:Uncharacterized protein n=1 Tax=Petromyces alliaceus TaxID=209559 RepID=A0A8H6ADN5_PETAA|nr:hypothetical protein ETB97_007942 [Aspergillus burnettii]
MEFVFFRIMKVSPSFTFLSPGLQDTPAADGGRPWPSYVGQYIGARFHNYAVSGAVCSNSLTPRIAQATGELFPDVSSYQVPAFFADRQYTYPNGTKFMGVPPESTVYAIMIGGNDVRADGYLTDSQTKGTTIADYIDCVFQQIDRLFQRGARNFVIHTLGTINTTGVAQRMLEQVALVNAFALVDLEGLMKDTHKNPSRNLNGTVSYNVTGYINRCSLNGTECVRYDNDNRDAFIWYDELHPSEQTWRSYAKNFVSIINGRSKWATHLSA